LAHTHPLSFINLSLGDSETQLESFQPGLARLFFGALYGIINIVGGNSADPAISEVSQFSLHKNLCFETEADQRVALTSPVKPPIYPVGSAVLEP
jgi:hypothetical protein